MGSASPKIRQPHKDPLLPVRRGWVGHGAALPCLQGGRRPPDDVVMPHLNGRDLADRLRAQRPNIRVLYMSGYADDILARHGLLTPEIAIVPKPFTASSLAHQVRARLDE